jgi:hypothetical protein
LTETDTIQKPVALTSGNPANRIPYSLNGRAELEKLDRQAGYEYVPMDVFVDPRAMREHFQDSSIRARWAGIHPAAA